MSHVTWGKSFFVTGLGFALFAGCMDEASSSSNTTAAPDEQQQADFNRHGGGAPVVIASNLDQPRDLAFGPDGLYVAEGGRGGMSQGCVPGPLGQACFGPTAAITKISFGHGPPSQTRVVTGLSSFAAPDGTGAFGAHGISFTPDGTGYFTDGGCITNNSTCGRLFRLGSHGGFTEVADLTAFELANNPDGLHPGESDPYGVLATQHTRYVADAAANDLLAISDNGTITVAAVFPQRTVSGIAMDSVPTGVVQSRDGSLIVGELTGVPFPVGGARLYRVTPGLTTPVVITDGFTNILNIAEDDAGNIYVVELAKNSLASGDPTGDVVRVDRNGQHRTVVVDNLFAPTGVTVDHDGNLYISIHGEEPAVGQVIFVPRPH